MKRLLAFAVACSAAYALSQLPPFQPAPEMKLIAGFLGEWSGDFKLTAPGAPPTTMPAHVKEELYGGGVWHKTYYTMKAGNQVAFEGTSFMTWDATKKKFKTYTFETGASEPRIEWGTFDGKKLINISEPHGGMVSRTTFEFVGADTLKFKIEFQDGDQWMTVGECTFKKKA